MIKSLTIFTLLIPLLFACQEVAQERNIKRVGMVITLKPEDIVAYEQLHANVWPGVLEQLSRSNISNYSIFRHDTLLFGYFEYIGDDYDTDMRSMAMDSTTIKWWEITDSYQTPLPTRAKGEWWATMKQVFFYP